MGWISEIGRNLQRSGINSDIKATIGVKKVKKYIYNEVNLTKSSKRCPQLVTDHVRNLWLFKTQKVNIPVVNVVVTWVSSWDDFCTRRAYFFFYIYKKSCFSKLKKESECLLSKLYNSDNYVLSNVLFVFHVRLLSHLKLFSHFFYFKKSGMDSNSTRLSCGLHFYT